LTVPSIVTSVQKSKNRALLKETYQLLRDVHNNGILTGEFDSITSWDVMATGPGTAVDYFTSKFNAVKRCDATDLTSAGCKQSNTNWAATSDAHNARWILPNGVKIQASWMHGYGFWRNYGITGIGWTIITDANLTNANTTASTLLRVNCDTVGRDQTAANQISSRANNCTGLVNPGDSTALGNLFQ
jgi:hypothetical protein